MKILEKIFLYVVMISVVLVSLFPLLWVILSSVKTNGEILAGPFVLPSSLYLDGYKYVLTQYHFFSYALNSIIVAIVPLLIAIPAYAMAAYVIAKYQFPFRKTLYALFTITLLIPAHARTQPLFTLIYQMNLYDTKTALILIYLSLGMAMSIFILKATFMAIPKSLDEAATIDGAGFFRTFFVINAPLAKNGLLTAGVLMFLANWNEFYFASLFTISAKHRTLPIMTNYFNSDFSYDYTKTFVALTLLIVPGIIIYALAQEQISAGVASTGIKG